MKFEADIKGEDTATKAAEVLAPTAKPFSIPRRQDVDKALVIKGPGNGVCGPGDLEMGFDDDVDEAAQMRYAQKIVRILNAHWHEET